MPEILILEGLTDATFFQELLARLYLQDVVSSFGALAGRRNMPMGIKGSTAEGTQLEVEFRYTRENGGDSRGGKTQIPAAIRLLLDGGVRKFAVAQDIDDGNPDELLRSVHGVVLRHLNLSDREPELPSNLVALEGVNITVIPMGLHQDPTLSDFEITSHELEDYLIMLVLEDEGLRQNVPELRKLLSEILPTIRQHEGPFEKSKELFQLIKPMVQHGFSDTGVVQKLVRDADEAILRTVLAPLLIDVERAFAL